MEKSKQCSTLNRNIAFAAIVVSVVSVTTAVLSLPLFFYNIQMLEINVQQTVELCNFKSIGRFASELDGAQENGLARFRRAVKILKSSSADAAEFMDPLAKPGVQKLRDDVGRPLAERRSLDFHCCTCQRGPHGPPGLPGADGIDGSRGKPGQPGQPGNQGVLDKSQLPHSRSQCPCISPPGIPGSPGVPGTPGQSGDPGVNGLNGKPGPQGTRGPPGHPGSLGQMGLRGPCGEPGVQRVMQGSPGPRGDLGRPGSPGAPGSQGQMGQSGPVGSAGEKGLPGIDGKSGKTGAQGPDGGPGATGDPGSCIQCPPARLASGY